MTSIRSLADRGRVGLVVAGVIATLLTGCASSAGDRITPSADRPRVLASESFLADIAQNVAGDRLQVESLIPAGLDPHAFDPTPSDLQRIAESQVLIINGAGFEAWLEPVLKNARGEQTLIEASAGLASRQPDKAHAEDAGSAEEHDHGDVDPHFWLDPNNVARYAENIRDGLSKADPAGKEVYAANAAAYLADLRELDAWIKGQVAEIPAERRLLVTNHESFGYFADRYGFKVIGTVIPSFSTGSSPSAQQMAQLTEEIKASGAPAIFLETGSSPQLARQIAGDTGAKVVTDLYTHSLTPADGAAPSYIAMMRHDVRTIVEALR
jgi:ABC-type Zn uptake system ZnuABC Zn-binding protein ZnuA